MCQNLYELLIFYFDNPKNEDEREENEFEACRYAINVLIPYLYMAFEKSEEEYMPKYYELWQKAYALAGRRSLEHFIDYMELDLSPQDKVLGNRRNVLRPLVFYLNKSAFDPKLMYVMASYPPSYGKTYTLNNYSAWLFGLRISNSVLRLSYSEELVLTASRAVQNLIRNPRFGDIFPRFKLFGNKPFEKEKESDWILKDSGSQTSHISRTREGSVTGVRANKAIIFDDMTKGADEATDSATHAKLYNRWKTEWYNRKTGRSTKYIFAGTMWSPEDILNRVSEDIQANVEMKPSKIKGFGKWVLEAVDGSAVFIRVPLIDENDKCTCLPVMSTQEARNVRDTTDEFLFSCVYQQAPIAPTGLNFADELLNHYERLPVLENGEQACRDYCFAVLDTTRKGKDNVSMPIFKTDGIQYYLVDCIFKAKAMTDLYDEIIAKIEEHNITWLVVENNTDTSLKTLLEDRLKQKGVFTCIITEKYNTVKKELRIKDQQGLIRKLLVFKDKKIYKPNTDYGRFMGNLTKYSFDYPNKHDDAPDSLALFVTEIILERGRPSKPKPINRYRLGI